MIRQRCVSIVVLAAMAAFSLFPRSVQAITYAYIPDAGGNQVVRVDTTERSTTAVALEGAPYGAAVMPNGSYVLVTCVEGNTLAKITNANFIGSGEPLSITVGNEPRGVAIDPSGQYAYVANTADNSISVIQLSTFTVSTTIDNIGSEPWGVAAHYDESSDMVIAYVSNYADGSVSVIEDNNPSGTISVGGNPIGLALSPDGSRLYVADNNPGDTGRLIVIRTSDRSIIEVINAGNGPWGVAVGSDGEHVYLSRKQTASPSTVSVYYPAQAAIVDINIGTTGLSGIAAPKYGSFAYTISPGDGDIFDIDAEAQSAALAIANVIEENISFDAFALGAFIGGTRPAPPSALEATADDYDTVTLTWADNSTDEIGFKIERRGLDNGDYVEIAEVAENTETYTDPTLEELTTYEYRIRSYNEAAASEYTTLAEGVTTLEGQFSWCFIGVLLQDRLAGTRQK